MQITPNSSSPMHADPSTVVVRDALHAARSDAAAIGATFQVADSSRTSVPTGRMSEMWDGWRSLNAHLASAGDAAIQIADGAVRGALLTSNSGALAAARTLAAQTLDSFDRQQVDQMIHAMEPLEGDPYEVQAYEFAHGASQLDAIVDQIDAAIAALQ